MGVKVCCWLVLGVVLQVLMVNESVRGKQVRMDERCLRYVHRISIFLKVQDIRGRRMVCRMNDAQITRFTHIPYSG